MTKDNQEIIGGVAAVMGFELAICLAILIGAAIAVKIDAIGFAIMAYVDFAQ